MNVYHFGGLLLNDTPTAESRVHPIIDYNYMFANPVLGGELSCQFQRSELLARARLTDGLGVVRNVDSEINRVSADVGWRRRWSTRSARPTRRSPRSAATSISSRMSSTRSHAC